MLRLFLLMAMAQAGCSSCNETSSPADAEIIADSASADDLGAPVAVLPCEGTVSLIPIAREGLLDPDDFSASIPVIVADDVGLVLSTKTRSGRQVGRIGDLSLPRFQRISTDLPDDSFLTLARVGGTGVVVTIDAETATNGRWQRVLEDSVADSVPFSVPANDLDRLYGGTPCYAADAFISNAAHREGGSTTALLGLWSSDETLRIYGSPFARYQRVERCLASRGLFFGLGVQNGDAPKLFVWNSSGEFLLEEPAALGQPGANLRGEMLDRDDGVWFFVIGGSTNPHVDAFLWNQNTMDFAAVSTAPLAAFAGHVTTCGAFNLDDGRSILIYSQGTDNGPPVLSMVSFEPDTGFAAPEIVANASCGAEVGGAPFARVGDATYVAVTLEQSLPALLRVCGN